MTPFNLLLQLTGLSHREAGFYLNVREDTVSAWARGYRDSPRGVLEQMRDLVGEIESCASQALDVIEDSGAERVTLHYCVSDQQARERGLPSVGAHNSMLARVVAELDADIDLQPIN